jgi:hypothetical protein
MRLLLCLWLLSSLTACPPLPREVTLTPGAYHGTLVGPDGPVAGALVRALGRPGGVVSDAEGRFVLPMDIATTATVVATAGGDNDGLAALLTFEMGLVGVRPEAVELGPITMSPAVSLQITGVAAGALVVAVREDASRPTEVMTNEVAAADTMTLRHLPAGRYVVMSTAADGTVSVSNSTEVAAGQSATVAMVAVEDLVVVQPTDVRASALPQGDVTATLLIDRALDVGLANPPIQNEVASTQSNELSFVWPNLPAGVWNASLTFNDGRAGAATIAVLPGVEQTTGQLLVADYPACACEDTNLEVFGCNQAVSCADFRARMLLSAPGLLTADQTVAGAVRDGACVVSLACP